MGELDEAGGGGCDADRAGLDAAVTFAGLGVGLGEPVGAEADDLVVEARLVLLDEEQEVGAFFLDEELCVAALGVHRVRGDQAARQVEAGEHRAEHLDLIGLVVDLLLGDHHPLVMGHRR